MWNYNTKENYGDEMVGKAFEKREQWGTRRAEQGIGKTEFPVLLYLWNNEKFLLSPDSILFCG